MCDGEEGGCYITKLFTATSCSCVNNAQKWRDRERERERERGRERERDFGSVSVKVGESQFLSGGTLVFQPFSRK